MDSEEVRIKSVENRVDHLDEMMSKLAQNQAALQSTLEGVVSSLKQIQTTVNAPNNTNWWALIGAVGVVVGILGGFMNIRIGPIERAQDAFSQRIQKHSDVFTERGYTMGMNKQQLISMQNSINDLWEHDERVWNELRRLGREAAVAEVSHSTIGDYVKTIDEQGPRKWSDKGSPP